MQEGLTSKVAVLRAGVCLTVANGWTTISVVMEAAMADDGTLRSVQLNHGRTATTNSQAQQCEAGRAARV